MSINTPDANSILMGGSSQAARFEYVGQTIGGRVVTKPSAYQVREYRKDGQPGALKYFPSGDPIMGIYVDVQTELREDADDDGVRRLWIEKQRQLAAVRDAVRHAGAEGVDRGGSLWLTWTGTEIGKGDVEAKTWSATYQAGAVAVPGGAGRAGQTWGAGQPTVPMNTGSQSGMTQPAQQQQPVQQQPVQQPETQAASAAPARPQVKASVAAALANAGVDVSGYDIVAD